MSFLLAVVLLAAATGDARPATPDAARAATAPEAARAADTTALIREVTAEVEQLRGLHRKVNLKVELLDGPLFTAQVREKAKADLTPRVVAEERARWLAFDLAPGDADPLSILLGVLDEQVAGFYDPHEKKLFVRTDAGMSRELMRLVLAHEIEHALQDQTFGMPDLAALPNDDVRLARMALLEGDAMAVMAAYAARRGGRPVKEAIAAAAEAMLHAEGSDLMANAEKLKRAPAVVREELLFPYAQGFALVAEAYQRGGFALVDKLFANPPSSTHQVLHPAAYFSGEELVPVPPPALPAGAKLLAQGRMGELGTRLALEVCVDAAVARELSPSWAGDAFTIYEIQGHAELIWETAWTAGGAQRAANLFRLFAPCWQEQPGMAHEVHIAKKGGLVAVARGAAEVESVLAVPVPKPPQPARPLTAPR